MPILYYQWSIVRKKSTMQVDLREVWPLGMTDLEHATTMDKVVSQKMHWERRALLSL